jgi:ABC-2 type transport system permease protein
VINAIRSELLKMRSTPGPWVAFGLALPLTVLALVGIFATAGGFPGHTFFYADTLELKRELLGAGYGLSLEFLAPIIGVICITSEYRHKTMTTTLVISPVRQTVLLAKVVVTVVWSLMIAILSVVVVAAVGLPWNSALGGTPSSVIDQAGAVIPGFIGAAVLLGLFGLGFGTLVKNQVAGVLFTIGGTFILEPLLVALASAIFHWDLNWLPSSAAAALAGDVARGFGSNRDPTTHLLSWWLGGLAMLGWGVGPLAIGYFTTFRRDVT